jgi:hypothetical protein
METQSWLRTLATVVLVPLLLMGLSTYFIPGIIDEANKREAIRTARLRKSLDVGDRNKDFTSKLHVLMTRMQMFNTQNARRKLWLNQLRETQKTFQEKYTDQYLILDEVAWWRYQDMEREAQAFSLLSPTESEVMHKLSTDYVDNTAKCVGALNPLWSHLSSSEYDLGPDSQKNIERLEKEMISKLDTLNSSRAVLVKEMATLLAQSQYEEKAKP